LTYVLYSFYAVSGFPITKDTNDLQIEQGIATQRLRLFRLVTGLLIAVAFVSAAPFSRACRCWMCGAILSILSRAELAVQYLVISQARIIAARCGVRVQSADLFAAMERRREARASAQAVLPSVAHLRRRLIVLRDVLAHLPRHGLRLLRRVLGSGVETIGPCFAVSLEARLSEFRLIADPIERPPDKRPSSFRCL